MKNFFYVMMGLILSLALSSCSCELIEPGEAGIVVDLYGGESSKKVGKENKEKEYNVITAQRVWVGIGEKLYKMPVSLQTYVWTRDASEQSSLNEEIKFDTKEGSTVSADVAIGLTIDPKKVGHLFNKYNKPIKEIISTQVKNQMRISFNKVTSTMNVEDILTNKSEINKRVFIDVANAFKDDGLIFEYLGFISALRYPPNVQTKMDEVLSQKAKTQKSLVMNEFMTVKSKNDTLQSLGDKVAQGFITQTKEYEVTTLGNAKKEAALLKVKLIGKDGYALIQKMDNFIATLNKAPKESNFEVFVYPSGSEIVSGSAGSKQVILGNGK